MINLKTFYIIKNIRFKNLRPSFLYVHIYYIGVHVNIYLCTHICVHMNIYVFMCIHVNIHTHVCVHVNIHIHSHTQTIYYSILNVAK